jgi:hypothetical protein
MLLPVAKCIAIQVKNQTVKEQPNRTIRLVIFSLNPTPWPCQAKFHSQRTLARLIHPYIVVKSIGGSGYRVRVFQQLQRLLRP